MSPLIVFLAILLMILGLLAIPVGLPGLWIMIGVVATGLVLGEVSLATFLALFGLGIAAELAEWVSVDRLGRRFGGSRKTFWGALAGGAGGAFVGAPVPVFGPVVGAMAGTLAGAVLATWFEVRHAGRAMRAGWGALIGRALAVAIKVFAGLVVLIVGGGAFLV